MQLDVNKNAGVVVVTVQAESLDASVAGDFKQRMETVARKMGRYVVLDLAAVRFVDSSGLGAIISMMKLLQEDGNLALASICDEIMSMFRLTRMDRVLHIYEDVPSAVSALQS